MGKEGYLNRVKDTPKDAGNGLTKERELACNILDRFSEFLENKGVKIPNEEREEAIKNGEIDEKEADVLYGTEYYSLEDEITEAIEKGYDKVNSEWKAKLQEIRDNIRCEIINAIPVIDKSDFARKVILLLNPLLVKIEDLLSGKEMK